MAMVLLSGAAKGQLFSDDYFIRKINLRVLRALDEYERMSSFIQPRYYEEYYDLFAGEEVQVPVDMLQMGLVHHEVDVDRYIQLTKRNWSPEEYGLDVQILINDVGPLNREAWEPNQHKGTVDIKATKVITGYAHPDCKCKEALHDSIPLVITYRFDFEGNSYLIEDIDTEAKGRRTALLAVRIGDLLHHVPASRLPIELPTFETQVVRETTDSVGMLMNAKLDSAAAHRIAVTSKGFEGKISKVTLLRNALSSTRAIPDFSCGDFDTIVVDFRLPRFAIELGGGFLIPALPMIASELRSIDAKVSHSTHLSLGLHGGVYLRYSSRGYWLVKTGIAWEQYGYRINVDSFGTTYDTSDPSGVPYERTAALTDIQETRRLSYLSMPLLIEKGFALPFRLKAFACAGGRLMFPIERYYESTAKAQYSGRYPDHFNITIRENGVYDFGTFSLQSQGKLNVMKPLLIAELGAGLKRQVVKRMDIGIGLRYNLSINRILEQPTTALKLSRNSTELNSLGVIDSQARLSFLSLTAGLTIKL